MLIFRNPGLVDLEAVRTLGVSVKREGSFGRFGTGLKFAIATVLRGGGSVTLYRGLKKHTFGTVDREVRGQVFQVVTLDKKPMGITTQLGRDWEPWMVLREFGCNAIDEGGAFDIFAQALMPTTGLGSPVSDETRFAVTWPELDTAYHQRKELFLEGEPIWKSAHIRILSGPSAHIFYRGVRVLKLEKPSTFTYDILDEQTLTEDRTLAGTWRVERIIADALLTMTDKTLVSQAITAGDGYYESKVDLEPGYGVKVSKAFLDAAVEAREKRTLKSETARKTLLKHIRESAEETSTYGSYRRVVEDAFAYALEQLGTLGISFSESQQFVKVDELPEGVMAMVENGRVYYVDALEHLTAREIATELLTRWVDLNVKGYDREDVTRLLAPYLIKACPAFVADECLVKEDEVVAVLDWRCGLWHCLL